jgi:hypothetical protein
MPAPRWLGKMWPTRWAKWYAVHPQTTLGQISIAPWKEQPPPREKKRNWIISNNSKKDMQQRGQGTLSSERGRGSPSQAGWRRQEQQHCSAIRRRKACKSDSGRKTPQERREDPLPMWTVNKHVGLRKLVQCHSSPTVLGKGKACSSRIMPRRTLSKQSLRG